MNEGTMQLFLLMYFFRINIATSNSSFFIQSSTYCYHLHREQDKILLLLIYRHYFTPIWLLIFIVETSGLCLNCSCHRWYNLRGIWDHVNNQVNIPNNIGRHSFYNNRSLRDPSLFMGGAANERNCRKMLWIASERLPIIPKIVIEAKWKGKNEFWHFLSPLPLNSWTLFSSPPLATKKKYFFNLHTFLGDF